MLDVGTRTYNALLRCFGERGFAILTGRWRALQRFTASPRKISDIVKAAVTLTHFEHGKLSGGQRPLRVSMAMVMSASGEDPQVSVGGFAAGVGQSIAPK